MCEEATEQCGRQSRWDVVPELDCGRLQSEQHITSHASSEPSDQSSQKNCKQRQPAVPGDRRPKGSAYGHGAHIHPDWQRVE